MVVRTFDSRYVVKFIGQTEKTPETVPGSPKDGSVAVWRNVGSYSRGVSTGSWASVAIDLESLGARHCLI